MERVARNARRRGRSVRAAGAAAAVETLECRSMMHVAVVAPVADVSVAPGTAAANIDLAGRFDNDELTGTIVRIATTQGNIDLELYDTAAPITVANFLKYVNSGRYNDTWVHRAPVGFVDQFGGFYGAFDAQTGALQQVLNVTTDAPIQNEYSATRPNVRGSIAMAKLGGDPNSATSGWFINLKDNRHSINPITQEDIGLDVQNGGFTVFGEVIGNGMQVADAINQFPKVGGGGTFTDMPLVNYNGGDLKKQHLVVVTTASIVPEIASYAVSSTNPAVANAVLNGNAVSLTYGAPGTAQVSVTATDVLGNTVTDTFTVNVVPPGFTVSSGGVPLASGQAAPIDFGRTNLATTSANPARTLTITNNGVAPLSFGNIAVPAGFLVTPPADPVAPGQSVDVQVQRDLAVTGLASGNLTITSSDPAIPAFVVPLTGEVVFGVTLQTGKNAAVTYTDADGTVTTLALAGPGSADVFFTGGGMSAATGKGVKVSGSNLAISELTFAGTNAASKLTITTKGGNGLAAVGEITSATPVGSVSGKGVMLGAAGLTSTLAGVGVLDVNVLQDATLQVNGAVGTLSAGAINGSVVTVTGAVGSLAVKGAIANSTVRASAIAKASAASVAGSKLYAGYAGSGLPAAAGDLAPASAIGSLAVKGAFSNTLVAAGSLGKVSLGSVVTGNAGTAFGVAGDRITSLVAKAPGKSIKLAKLDDPAAAAAAVAKLGDLGDFKIAVL